MIGLAFIPLLVKGQDAALDSAGLILQPVVLDQAAPKLVLTNLQGQTVSLAESLGKVVLVNNWATWCPPCNAEMPELQAYFQAHADQNFLVIAIESGDSADAVGNFVRQHGLTFPVWLDQSSIAVDAFQNRNLPSSYVVDRNGVMRMSWTGEINQATLEKYVTPLLEK